MSLLSISHRRRAYRRLSELKRPSNFRLRLMTILIKWCLYILLIPATFGGMIVGASLKLGSTWGEAFSNVSLVADATVETYKTHAHLLKLSAEILLSLEKDEAVDDLDMIVYVAEVRSKTSALSASVDQSLVSYLKGQVEKKKALHKNSPSKESFITLKSLLISSLIGALVPILLYWILGYILTRIWLDKRAHETVEIYLSRQSDLDSSAPKEKL